MKKLSFFSSPLFSSLKFDVGILWLRVLIGSFMLFSHGLPKLLSYSEKAAGFPDPIGLGSSFSLIMAIFAELFCSLLLIAGVAVRFAVIPLMITMLVAAFVIHADDPFMKKEFALLYFIPYVTLFFTGAGKFNLQRYFGKSSWGN